MVLKDVFVFIFHKFLFGFGGSKPPPYEKGFAARHFERRMTSGELIGANGLKVSILLCHPERRAVARSRTR